MFPWYLHEAAAPDFCLEVGFQIVYFINKVSFREESKEKKTMGKTNTWERQVRGKTKRTCNLLEESKDKERVQNTWQKTARNDHPSLLVALGTVGIGQ